MNESLVPLSPEEEKKLEVLDKAFHTDTPEHQAERIEKACKKFKCNEDELESMYEYLCDAEAMAHEYVFVGRVGQFCPVKAGSGGGILVRGNEGKYYAVTGTKKDDGTPYRWLESEMVKSMNWEDMIDLSYYKDLVDKAADAIAKYGDLEWFTE